MTIFLLSQQAQPETAPTLFQRGVEHGKRDGQRRQIVVIGGNFVRQDFRSLAGTGRAHLEVVGPPNKNTIKKSTETMGDKTRNITYKIKTSKVFGSPKACSAPWRASRGRPWSSTSPAPRGRITVRGKQTDNNNKTTTTTTTTTTTVKRMCDLLSIEQCVISV